MSGCYLIHFDTPYKHARHYIGYSDNIPARIEQHRKCCGARLMEVVTRAGITWQLARVWEGADRNYERKLHRFHGANKLCPICKGE